MKRYQIKKPPAIKLRTGWIGTAYDFSGAINLRVKEVAPRFDCWNDLKKYNAFFVGYKRVLIFTIPSSLVTIASSLVTIPSSFFTIVSSFFTNASWFFTIRAAFLINASSLVTIPSSFFTIRLAFLTSGFRLKCFYLKLIDRLTGFLLKYSHKDHLTLVVYYPTNLILF